MKESETKTDVRVQATGTIWGIAVGMMAVSIPLADITHTAAIPLAVIVGAAVGTCAVWRSGRQNEIPRVSPTTNNDQIAAQQRIAELEERLANLETINNFERRLAEETLKRHDLSAVGTVMKDEQSEMTSETNSQAVAV